MRKIKLRVWDPAAYLLTEEDMTIYLAEAIKEAEPTLISVAIDDVARALCMKRSDHGTSQKTQPTL